MNVINSYHHASASEYPNLLIGGLGSTITNKADLASYFEDVLASDISLFNVDVNNNIQCHIDKDLKQEFNAIKDNANLTYFIFTNETKSILLRNRDFENVDNCLAVYSNSMINETGSNTLFYSFGMSSGFKYLDIQGLTEIGYVDCSHIQTFRDSNNLRWLRLPNLTFIEGLAITHSTSTSLRRVYLPSLTHLVSKHASVRTFHIPPTSAKFYLNTALDGVGNTEVTYLQGRCTVVFIDNTTPPSSIADLSASNITSTSVDLNFTTPSSTNTLDFYEVWIERQDLDYYSKERVSQRLTIHDEIISSGDTISGLISGTTYKIKIFACDEYWNRSEESNEIEITTS